MFAGSARTNQALSALFVVVIGGCGGMDSCGGRPMPAGGLPGYQTIEGGGQIRVTSAGMAKITSLVPGLVNSALSSGFCVKPVDIGPANFCSRIQERDACGNQPGCNVHVALVPGSVRLSTTSSGTLHIDAAIKLDATNGYAKVTLGTRFDCDTLEMHSDRLAIGGDIETGISAATGELTLRFARVTTFDVAAIRLSGCSILTDIAEFALQTFSGWIRDAAISAMMPLLQSSFQKFIPAPLGLEGVIDLSGLIGTNPTGPALLETRLVAGGYVNFANAGLNLGLITGVNSDADPTTREPTRVNNVARASEPSRCVPPIPLVDFNAPPSLLVPVSRSAITNGPAFALTPAGPFTGQPEAAGDLAVGISQTALNLFGHHLVTSGALCMSIGTSNFSSLNLGAFGVILPSIALLQTKEGNDPVLLVGRPQRAIGFTIGDNTPQSPAVTAQISHLEIDLYAFLFERYVRLLTLDFSAAVGINVEFESSAAGGASIKPVLVGVSDSSVSVRVINSDFVKEKPDDLEAVLPALFDVALQRIGSIRPIQVPSFAGFSLADLTLRRVTTDQDQFLAVGATLRPGAAARQLAAMDPLAAEAVAALDAPLRPRQSSSAGTARLLEVTTPAPARIRDALARTTGGALPTVALEVDRFDIDDRTGTPRELEWSWNINGGMWHPFHSGSPLVISDRTFALQGNYTIGLRSRVKGDSSTVSEATHTPVVIDSVGPRVFSDEAAWSNDHVVVPVRDAVGGTDVQVGFGTPGTDGPATEWVRTGDATLPRADFDRLRKDGEVAVFARDALGNETVELVTPVRDTSSGAGCGCRSGGGAGGLALIAICGAVGLSRRRRGVPPTR